MSKQVEKKGDVIQVRTSENYEDVKKVIFLKKGKTAKVFYPFCPSYLTIEEAENIVICGYRAGDLVKLAVELNGKGIDKVKLTDYNKAYFDGYIRAQEDIRKQLEESIKRVLEG